MAKHTCQFCNGSYILRSSIVNEEEGGRHIGVVVCAHHPQKLIEKALIDMHNASGLDIDIVSAEKPSEAKERTYNSWPNTYRS